MTDENGVIQVTPPVEQQEMDVNDVESAPVQQVEETNVEQDSNVVDVSNLDASFPVDGAGKIPEPDELDEKGVPYKNRFHEYKRKYEETTGQLQEIKDMVSTLTQAQQKKETQPEYTISDLEAYKAENPQHAAWCEQEKAKLLQKEILSSVRKEFEQREQQQQAQMIKQQSLQAVAMSFPDAFAKDSNGNVVGWDINNPITQRIMQYGKDPAIASRPDGLLYAAKLAAGDLYAQGLQQSKGIIAKQNAKVGSLQRKTAVVGSTPAPATQSQSARHMDELRQTGTREAARSALESMLFSS